MFQGYKYCYFEFPVLFASWNVSVKPLLVKSFVNVSKVRKIPFLKKLSVLVHGRVPDKNVRVESRDEFSGPYLTVSENVHCSI